MLFYGAKTAAIPNINSPQTNSRAIFIAINPKPLPKTNAPCRSRKQPWRSPNLPHCHTIIANLPCCSICNSESLAIHQQAQALFARYTNEYVQAFEHKHYDLIAQFGRYPHRNALLSRPNTPAEAQFLAEHGRGF